MKPIGKDERDWLIVGVAALFRAAGIVRSGDEDAKVQYRNTEAINQATEFVDACAARGLIVVELKKD